jgi:hypothetical protein
LLSQRTFGKTRIVTARRMLEQLEGKRQRAKRARGRGPRRRKRPSV